MEYEMKVESTRIYLERTLAKIARVNPELVANIQDRLHEEFSPQVNGHSFSYVVADRITEQAGRRGITPERFLDNLAVYDGNDWVAQMGGALFPCPELARALN